MDWLYYRLVPLRRTHSHHEKDRAHEDDREIFIGPVLCVNAAVRSLDRVRDRHAL